MGGFPSYCSGSVFFLWWSLDLNGIPRRGGVVWYRSGYFKHSPCNSGSTLAWYARDAHSGEIAGLLVFVGLAMSCVTGRATLNILNVTVEVRCHGAHRGAHSGWWLVYFFFLKIPWGGGLKYYLSGCFKHSPSNSGSTLARGAWGAYSGDYLISL